MQQRVLFPVFLGLSILGLALTWSQNLAYLVRRPAREGWSIS